jgi:glycerol uptake facilitator protein
VLGFVVAGKLKLLTAIAFILFEFLGAILASVLLWLYFYPHWAETKNSDLILACFATIPAIRQRWTNFLSEFMKITSGAN